MYSFRGLLRSIGRDDQEPRAAVTSRQRRKQIDSRIVRPVEVFQNEHQESGRSKVLDPLAEFTDHSRARGPCGLLPEHRQCFP